MNAANREKTFVSSAVFLPAQDFGSSWLIGLRLSFLGLALFSASFVAFFTDISSAIEIDLAFTILAFLFAFCLGSSLWVREREAGAVFKQLQVLADIFIITGVVYLTGGPISPFLFLYLPVIISAAVACSRRTAFVATIYATFAYGALVAALFFGLIHPADGSAVVELPRGGVFLQVVGLSSAMFLIAVATSYLSKRLEAQMRLVELSRIDMAALSDQQRQLFNDLPNGVLTIDPRGVVQGVNERAEFFLDAKSSELTGRKLPAVLKELGVSEERTLEELARNPEEVEISQGKVSKSILVYGRELSSKQGGMLFLQDVTEIRSIEEQLAVQERMTRLLSAQSEPIEELPSGSKSFVGESPVMKKVFSLIRRVSQSEATVLIG